MHAPRSRRTTAAILRLIAGMVAGVAGCSSSSDDDDPTGLETIQIPSQGTVTISVSPTRLVVQPGGSATATVTATSSNGAGIALAAQAVGLIGLSATISPASVASGGTATLTVSAASTAFPTTIPLTISGSVGTAGVSGIGSTSVLVDVPSLTNLSLRATPSSASAARGTTVQVGLLAMNAGNSSGSIDFTVTGAPTGITPRFLTPSCTIATPIPSCPASLSIDIGPGAPLGPVQLTVVGTGLGQAPTATIDLTVTAAPTDFSIAMSPATITLLPGQTATATAQITRLGSSVGTVTLGATAPSSPTGPGGPTGSSVQLGFNPTAASGPTSTVTVTAAANATPGTYPFTVRGDAGTASQTTPFTVTIVDFVLRALEPTIYMDPSDSCATEIVITRLGTLPTGITFSVQGLPSGATAVFVPNPVAGSATLVQLSIKTTNLPYGATYPLTIVGTVNGVSRTTSISMEIGYNYGGSRGGSGGAVSRPRGERKAGGHSSWPPARSG
jgi:hypothetical protein